MLKTSDIEMRLLQCEPGIFQKVCNEILYHNGYTPYKYTGSVKGSNKTKLGTPDSVFTDSEKKYVYVEITTQKDNLESKIKSDIEKCLNKISSSPFLNKKISKIIFMHNHENPDEIITEKIKGMCKNIEFEIYDISYLSSILKNECQDIAISLLDVRDDYQSINKLSPTALEQIADIIHQNQSPQFKDNTVEEIKTKINSFYEEAISIINSDEASIYISPKNKDRLKELYNFLKAFDFYYKNQDNENAKLYYHNLLVILSRYDLALGMDFYNKIPLFAKSNCLTIHFYSIILIEKEEYNDAKEILEELYFNKKYKNAFETLVRIYFLTKNYEKVITMLSGAKAEKFDSYGFLAAMFIISKNEKKKYSEYEILKLNNSKFKKMPLFYFCTAKLLYDMNNKNKKYKEQFKKGLKILNEKDVVSIYTMCNQALEINLEEDAISFLESINITSLVLKNKLLELLSRKKELSKKEIDFVENINFDLLDQTFDIDFFKAKISETKGKELEAIRLYKESFKNSNNKISAYRYIQLSIKNKTDIDESIISFMIDLNTIDSLMTAVEAYNHIGKYENAKSCSYNAIYLSKNNSRYQDAFKQFWYTLTLCDNKEENNIDCISKNCVIILKSKKLNKIILLEDDYYFKENDKFKKAIITRSYSDIGLKLLHKKKGEIITINKNEFIIADILDKYTYFARVSFKHIEKSKYIKCFTTPSNNIEEFIEQIKKEMIDINIGCNHQLDIYQSSNDIPLSALLSNENNFDEYAKLINTLLSDKERLLFAGENINVDLSDGFVIDISSMIILSIFDILDLIPKNFYSKIYITSSLKNKFQYFYNSLIRKEDSVERMLYIVDGDKLSLREASVIEQIKFWKKLNDLIGEFNVVDIESEKDNLLNDKTLGFLDKVQFDLITLSKNKNIPFICDDLMIRKISNTYEIKHTNSIQIIKSFSKDYDEYISILIKLSKQNYIYTLYGDTLSEMSKKLYENFDEHNKNIFKSVIESVLENKVSLDYYVPILLGRIEKLKSVQFITILEQVYENLFATFFIKNIYELIKTQCDKYGVDINKYK